MVDSRPQADRILVAQLTGEARHRAKWRELTADEERAAVAALAELAGGRADLLAEVAGIFEGTGEGELDQPLVRQAAALCLKAGADAEAIPAWIEEGRRRRSAAGRPPPSGGVRGPRLASCDTPGSSEIRHRVILRRTVSPMSATKIRLTAVIMDILDVISNSPPDNPAWGLRLCEATGYGTGTVYPALDRLLQAGWIEDKWEEPAPADRPRRRYYEITSAGRVAYREALSARAARRKAWTSPALHARGAA